MYYKLQIYKWLFWSLSHAAVLRSKFVFLSSAGRTGRVSVGLKSLAAALLVLPLYSEDKQYEVSWLFKPTNAT